MSSNSTKNFEWSSEILAVVKKEFLSEWRAPQALLTGGLFGISSVVAIAFAAFNAQLGPTLEAGLFYVVLLFATVGTLPRIILYEEESGTGDLLRLVAQPHSIYWGKQLFNLGQTLVLTFVLICLFVLFTATKVPHFGLLVLSLLGSAASLSGAATISGAISSRASNRQALAAAIALPLVLPIATYGVTSLRVAFGDGFFDSGRIAAVGLVCFGVISNSIGPFLYAAIWKN